VGDDDEAAGPPRHVRGIPCDLGGRVYDLTVVHCHDEDLDLGFVWRTPAPASAAAQAPGA
jgi:hypothetical protein